MSKTHWGGLRIGWLRAPARLVTEPLTSGSPPIWEARSWTNSWPSRCSTGPAELLSSRLEQLRQQRAALAAALTEHIPQWSWQLPPGGLSFWVDLGDPVASTLAERALDYGVRIESGACFAADPGVFEQRLRIPYTTPPDTLRDAVHRMATALAEGLPPTATARRAHWVA